jgi:hypothetical protein
MAGFYSPYGYNPYGVTGYPPPSLVQQGMGQPQQMPSQQNVPVVLYVPNVNQVKEVDMRGLSKAFIVVQNEPVIAMRTADSMGLTNTEYFTLTKYDPESVVLPSAPAQTYVTREEFDAFVASLKQPAVKGKKGDAE